MVCVASWVQAEPEVAGVMFTVGSTNEPRVVLPLKKTEVRIDVTAGIARTEVIQRFSNDVDRPLEAVYIFPLPSGAAVDDFEIRLKDRVIRSTVKERDAAKATYEQAKAEGRKAALLEQERPNIFTTAVANLLPGEFVDICFTYVESLRFQKDRFNITFPMVVGERYMPFRFDSNGQPKPEVADAARLNPPVLHPNMDSGHRLSIEVALNGLPIRRVTSTTHALKVEELDTEQYSVSLKNAVTIPDCEFSMVVQFEENERPSVTFVQSSGEEAYGLLSVFPPIGKQRKHEALPKDVVFLIDTSGSMSGASMAQAKSGLKRCIEILQPGDRFTVVRFASEFSSFSPELRDVTDKKVAEVLDYISEMTSGGGTEMQPALEHVLHLLPQESGRMPLVIFLTDGDVGNEDSLIHLLSKKLENTRLFTFGIGSAPNEFLMHRMAEVGRGQSRFIRSHEDVGDVMADFFQTLEAPVLTDVTVDWGGSEVHVYPERCPDIFYGRPLQLVAQAPAGFGGRIRINGLIDGVEQSYSIDLGEQKAQRHDAIEKLYGRMQVKDLMVQLMQTDDPSSRNKLKQAVIEVAMHHQLVTKFTSRVAVEERAVVEGDDLLSVKVPVPAPRGWTLYATATHETLQLLIGLAAFVWAFLFRRFIRAA